MKNNLSDIRHVIFNCDEVLIDHLTIFISALLDITESYGLAFSTDEAIKLFSHQNISETISILEKRYDRKFPQEMEYEFRTKLEQEFIAGASPLEGVPTVLSSLPVPFSAVSKLSQTMLKFTLKTSGLNHYFQEYHTFSALEINSNEDVYLHICQKMGLIPCQTIIIEGSLHGVKSAVQSGFTVYALANGFNHQELEEAGATVFDLMSELPKLLGFEILQ